MRDGIHIAALESIDKERDLGIYITRDLKSEEQCVQSAKKARSVRGMVKRHFKVIDKEDFLLLYKTYIRRITTTFRILCTVVVTASKEGH